MSRATHRIGQRADISASDASFWANQAYQEIAQAAPHALLEKSTRYSVISNTTSVALPSDYLETISLSWETDGSGGGGSSRTLRQTSPERADAIGFYPVGMPKEYFEYNNRIVFLPSADSYSATTSGRSFLHRYRAAAEDLVSLTSVPSIATEWRTAWLYLTEAFLHEHIGNEVEGAIARGRYAAYAASLKDTQARRQMAGGLRISLPQRKSRY